MNSNVLFYIIMSILLIQFIIEAVLEHLNAQRYTDAVPSELSDVFDMEEYQKSQEYKKTNYRFGMLSAVFSLCLTLMFLIFGGFDWIDTIARGFSDNPIVIALIFFGIIMIGNDIVTTPFSYYHTFVIEEKFGFNKSTRKLFWADKIKGWVMMIILGGGILALIIWFFNGRAPTFGFMPGPSSPFSRYL